MSRRVYRRAAAGFAAALLLSAPALAHHGWGGYDPDRPLQIEGTVREVTFDYPHGLLVLEAAEAVWEVVLAPPSRMRARGLESGQIATGDTVEVFGFPHRSKEGEMRAEWIRVGGQTTRLR